jgi:hypothetical protein
VIEGRRLVPATLMLGLMRKAYEGLLDTPAPTLTMVRWLVPLEIDGPRRVVIALNPAEDGDLSVTIRDKDAQPAIVNSQALFPKGSIEVELSDGVSPEELLTRYERSENAETLYARFARLGLSYGPAFRTVERLHSGPDACIGRLVEPAEANTGDNLGGLRPSILDGALQCLSGLLDTEAGGRYLPVSLDSLTLVKPMTATGYAHLTPSGESSIAKHAEDPLVDVRICEDSGDTVAILQGLAFRALPERQTATIHAFEPIVRPAPIDHNTMGELPDGAWLVFDNDDSRFSSLETALARQRPEPAPHLIQVRSGDRLSTEDGLKWQIKAGDRDQLHSLIEQVRSSHQSIQAVLYFWTDGSDQWQALEEQHDLGLESLERALDSGVRNLVFLAQALRGASIDQEIRILLASSGPSASPFTGALPGLARSLAQEDPMLDIRTLHLDIDRANTDWQAARALEELRIPSVAVERDISYGLHGRMMHSSYMEELV